MKDMENKNEVKEMLPEDPEKISAGSWVGKIWSRIKRFGSADAGSGDNQ